MALVRAIEDGVLHIRRDDPTLAQHFKAKLGAEAFTGQWQVAEEPGACRDDLRMVYTRVT